MYRDVDFFTSPSARALRIPGRILEPDCRFERERVEAIIVLFGSARALPLPEAEKLLETARFGGRARIMEACKRGARKAGGRSIGLNISLPHEQDPNPYISNELAEVLTLIQTGRSQPMRASAQPSAHRTRKLEEVLVSLPQRSRPVTSSRYSPGARSSST